MFHVKQPLDGIKERMEHLNTHTHAHNQMIESNIKLVSFRLVKKKNSFLKYHVPLLIFFNTVSSYFILITYYIGYLFTSRYS